MNHGEKDRYLVLSIPRCRNHIVSIVTNRRCGGCSVGARTPGTLSPTAYPSMGREPVVTTGRPRMVHVLMILEVTRLIRYLVVDMDYQQCYDGLLKRFPGGDRFLGVHWHVVLTNAVTSTGLMTS